ncbi:YcgL domain-containing protein [Alginatibacterium sediminis]
MKKQETYLYICNKDDFSSVPQDLIELMGQMQLVTLLNLKNKSKLARINIDTLRDALRSPGYFLQLPPPPVDYLKQHKAAQEQLKGLNDED